MLSNKKNRIKDMDEHNLSESEQMYVLSVALLEEQGYPAPIGLSLVSGFLGVAPVSTNQMVHKLAEQGYLEYLPYQGLQLTETGRLIANHVLRHRRLWQVFFESTLGLDSKTADDISCRLEHIVPCEAVRKLADFLDQPRFTRNGLSVPFCENETAQPDSFQLSLAKTGHTYRIEHSSVPFSIDQFLRIEGLVLNAIIKVEAVGEQGLLIRLPQNKSIQLTKTISDQIRVIPVSVSDVNVNQNQRSS
jgi:DtxR family Mn-dependent transcriptional regulator